MQKVLLGASGLFTLAALTGHAQSVSIAPSQLAAPAMADHAPRSVHVDRAVIGYLQTESEKQPQPITGTASAPVLEPPVSLPDAATEVYLPPGQRYAVLLDDAGMPSVFSLEKSSGAVRIPQVLGQVNLVAFSPRAGAAIFYSKATGKVQIVSGLPQEAAVQANIATEGLGEVERLAVADDAQFAVAEFQSGSILAWNAGKWRPLSIPESPAVWTFLPGSRELMVADPVRKEIASVSAEGTVQVLNCGSAWTHIVPTKDGRAVLAAADGDRAITLIQLGSNNAVTVPVPKPVDSLVALRDGHTFLTSSSALQLFDLVTQQP